MAKPLVEKPVVDIANGALFSKEQFQGLKNLRSLPPQASQQPLLNIPKTITNIDVKWNKTPDLAIIESSEGMIVPGDLDDETVFSTNPIDNSNGY